MLKWDYKYIIQFSSFFILRPIELFPVTIHREVNPQKEDFQT